MTERAGRAVAGIMRVWHSLPSELELRQIITAEYADLENRLEPPEDLLRKSNTEREKELEAEVAGMETSINFANSANKQLSDECVMKGDENAKLRKDRDYWKEVAEELSGDLDGPEEPLTPEQQALEDKGIEVTPIPPRVQAEIERILDEKRKGGA